MRDGGSVFPKMSHTDHHQGYSEHAYFDGALTLRDYFASAALPALAPVYQRTTVERDTITTSVDVPALARDAYTLADAMLAAREKS